MARTYLSTRKIELLATAKIPVLSHAPISQKTQLKENITKAKKEKSSMESSAPTGALFGKR